MNKKVFDILPPGHPPKAGPPTTFQEERPKPPLEKTIPSPLFAKKKWWIICTLLTLISAFLLCHFTLSRAEIEIWPVTELFTSETKVTCDKAIENVDVLNKVIPGELIKTEKLITEEFSSSGRALKEKKAEGIIRVYNNYSTLAQTLVANTRFVSADGKLFRSIEKVTLPGGKYEGGKFVSSYLDTKVMADQAGPEYNIGPSTFSIPGFAGTDRYTKIYGKSFQDMQGGLREEVPQVSQEDLDGAKKALLERALKESEASLKEKISSEFILLEGAIDSEILETFSLARPKDELEKFKFQVKAHSIALVFKREDLENFARDSILSQIEETKKISEKSLKLDYLAEVINLKAGKITISLKTEAKIYSDVGEPNLKKGLAGKSLAETKLFLESQPQIAKVEVKFWPMWIKNVPKDVEKIKIKLNLD
ncbi:hypothetical protein GW869_00185 [bacterium]|uniref:Baseplate protein J-like domain-containing protein n=4 Tax=Candidatus Nealsoniibacteriota TaxID=1817911 RepID=A0A2M7EB46_9BACT|nr:hypothetical protein [bacterium]PIV64949.1 MAG: hypothetical protein COS09_02225 [Candidatus Nealsonbacteria bacterium CG01_land_8_20_14_3_00_12]PIW34811.1 MAG: hypothetical protein COW25_02165 [Candidatus Nealsonbacteria bacterium CG15_BIG_FIL_POST_REV_8_21_14_020_37_12]PIW91580.1 MAG: hypothetical protein COZ90_00340 [Candidatus Nealsonbacteria bacterium CG_4_8_14_3_um_filter_37_36]PJA82714.1 MAG: hypothetical protein CO146_02530 [Candidatus Nealsonbacteria bacterium CG_4_9_14_3_um_filter_